MLRYTRDDGQAFSWYVKGFVFFFSKIHTLDGAKEATRSYYNHEWDESASRGSTQTRGVQPETWTDAEVEIVDERDKNQGNAFTNDAVGNKTANTTGISAGDAATEKATMRRLGEL